MKKQIFFKKIGKKMCQCAPDLLAVSNHDVFHVPPMCPKENILLKMCFILNNFVILQWGLKEVN